MEAFEEGIAMSKSPVCYNGDIFTVSPGKNIRREVPALNRVMIGRGVCAKSWTGQRFKNRQSSDLGAVYDFP